MDKPTKSTKKSDKNYSMNAHDREYTLEVMREKQYDRQVEKWEEKQQKTANWDMLDDYQEM